MIDPAKARYHLSPHRAEVLLGPVTSELTVIEARLAHFAERVSMTEGDRAFIQRAHDVIARARAGVIVIDLEARAAHANTK